MSDVASIKTTSKKKVFQTPDAIAPSGTSENESESPSGNHIPPSSEESKRFNKGVICMNNTSVPYIVYESEAARHERTVKRLIVALTIMSLLTIGTGTRIWKHPLHP